jgi:hypothetical protein
VTAFNYINDEFRFRYKIREYDFTAYISLADVDLFLMVREILRDSDWHSRLERSWAKLIPDPHE